MFHPAEGNLWQFFAMFSHGVSLARVDGNDALQGAPAPHPFGLSGGLLLVLRRGSFKGIFQKSLSAPDTILPGRMTHANSSIENKDVDR
ncbi:MAG: hypothetical protein PHG11_08980 [Eubacteriales bacterium]|nr:hypothetical protein [Eubacteriales bacterium]